MATSLSTQFGAIIACLSLAFATASATDYPSADHGGGDLTLHTGDRIWGTHTGLGRFVIPDGEVVVILPYTPSTPDSGGVSIYATMVEILGALDGNAAGYTGGGGAAKIAPGVGGSGSYAGFDGVVGWYNSGICTIHHSGGEGTWYSRFEGFGHDGDGPAHGFGGRGLYSEYNSCTGASLNTPPANASSGGYGTATGQNNDVSIDDSIMMGSGGGGGGGGPDGHAQGGGNGGGTIRIAPSIGLLLGPQSRISADGAWGALPISPNGGNSWPPTYTFDGSLLSPRRGGAGSGGGICIDLRLVTDEDQLVIHRGAAVSSITPSDPASTTSVGGTVKIMRENILFSAQLAKLSLPAGRTFMSGNFASDAGQGWDLYE